MTHMTTSQQIARLTSTGGKKAKGAKKLGRRSHKAALKMQGPITPAVRSTYLDDAEMITAAGGSAQWVFAFLAMAR